MTPTTRASAAVCTRPADDRLMTTEQVSDLLAVSMSTLEDWRNRPSLDHPGPPYTTLGARAVRYWRSDVMAWIESQTS